ncbi:uncharacterized protein LOC109711735 [Ananas comosus]|uniref:Uncharacterized protein LOC109711735 n=1 Tax=Ananas comosus TaxID=4615 RepID=A0A6P5F3I7_ANACO|nr:uncharacterized protein LOC109711735 [Ananas comosus]
MGYDAMANCASANASIPRDISKKKKGNRSAKLKQCKLDARREQWLSQVKSKDGKASSAGSPASTASPPRPQMVKSDLAIRLREEEQDGSDLPQEMSSDLDSPIQSPNSRSYDDRSRKRSPADGSNSGSSGSWSSQRSINFLEDEDGGNGDNWEAVADALSAINSQNRQTATVAVDTTGPTASHVAICAPSGRPPLKPEPVWGAPGAWRPDDAFRPQSLPSILKQGGFASSMGRLRGAVSEKGILPLPLSCPICCEDFDLTDSSFCPCSCGFRLCLFCHKRILEEDGRCPGCRKQYDHIPSGSIDVNAAVPILPMQLLRSCSMNARY